MTEIGGVTLVIVDTSAAYFEGDDENNNTQAGKHARLLRRLTTVSGAPTVLVACHPTKAASNDSLLPRGGGAFLNEMDGNLACQKHDAIIDVTTASPAWPPPWGGSTRRASLPSPASIAPSRNCAPPS